MLEYDDRNDFINDNFHGPSTSQFSRFVVVDATMNALKRNVSPVARRLLGNDINKIMRIDHAIDHLDQLLDVKPSGQFEPLSIVQCIRWCEVLPSTRKHRDNERIFYEDYLKPNYQGTHTWPAWNTVFTHRQSMGNDERQRKLDAASFDKKFKDFMGREILDLAEIGYPEFEKFIEGKEDFFAKPNIGESGKGIEKLHVADFKDTKELYDYIKNPEKNFGVIEEVIVQHPDVARIYPYSLNCLRVVTLVNDGKVEVLYAVFKMGNNGKFVDNLENGGLACHVDLDKGEICGQGHTSALINYDAHPATGIKFIGYKLPYIEEVKELAKKAALVIPNFGYVGWDICITPDGPLIVEGNDFPAYDFPQLPDPGRPRIGLIPKIESMGVKVKK